MTEQAFQAPMERPAQRYGDRRPNPRRRMLLTVVLGGLALVAVVGWLWLAVVRASPAVRYDLLGFQASTPTSVDIRFSVVRDPGVSVACILRARGAGGEEVGRRQVLLPDDTGSRSEVTFTVRTTGPAVTGEVLACLPYDGAAAAAGPRRP